MKYLQIFYLFLALSIMSCNESKQDQSCEPFFKNFFSLYEKEGVKESLNYAYSTNKWILNEHPTETRDVITKLEDFTSNLGKYSGYKLLKGKVINDHYLARSYIILYERQPIRFTFVLYRSEKTWQLQSFQYDVGTSDEVVNSMNLSW
jgi:hypothetical protein